MNHILALFNINRNRVDPVIFAKACRALPMGQFDESSEYIKHSINLVNLRSNLYTHSRYGKPITKHLQSEVVISGSINLFNEKQLIETLNLPKNLDIPHDTIVIHAYLKWGTDCLNRLDGHYQFILHDPRSDILFSAISPSSTAINYFIKNDLVCITNNFQVIQQIHDEKLEIHTKKIAEIALKIPGNLTDSGYENISRIPPAHYLLIHSGKAILKRFWRPQKQATLNYKNPSDYYEHFFEVINGILKDHIRQYPNISMAFSGGLDSCTINYFLTQALAEHDQRLTCYFASPYRQFGEPEVYKITEHLSDYEATKLYYDFAQNFDLEFIHETDNQGLNTLEKYAEFCHKHGDAPDASPVNASWITAMMKATADAGGKVLLLNTFGDASMSWNGYQNGIAALLRYTAGQCYRAYKNRIWDNTHIKHHSTRYSQAFMRLFKSRNQLSQIRHAFNCSISKSTVKSALQLYYNVDLIDPTRDPKLIEFCLKLPLSVYHNQNKNIPLKRCLIRQGMVNKIPKAILSNPAKAYQSLSYVEQTIVQLESLTNLTNHALASDTIREIFSTHDLTNMLNDLEFSTPKHARSLIPFSDVMLCLSWIKLMKTTQHISLQF